MEVTADTHTHFRVSPQLAVNSSPSMAETNGPLGKRYVRINRCTLEKIVQQFSIIFAKNWTWTISFSLYSGMPQVCLCLQKNWYKSIPKENWPFSKGQFLIFIFCTFYFSLFILYFILLYFFNIFYHFFIIYN